MKLFRYTVISLFIFSLSVFASPKKIDWTIAMYAAIDEEDLDHHAGEIIRNIENLSLPDNVELFFQSDDVRHKTVLKYKKVGDSIDKSYLKEHNAANPVTFGNFLNWVKNNRTNKNSKLLLNVATHSWGWKGIIQDFTMRGQEEGDSMMLLRDFAKTVKNSGLKLDILLLDFWILGNVEPIEEFKDLAPYLVVSQRETPYGGFPMQTLFNTLMSKDFTVKELAKILPEIYTKAYTRDGEMSENEGEFDIITIATIDTGKWSAFTKKFKEFTSVLKENGFREKLKKQPNWFKQIADIDQNVDVVEFLKRVNYFMANNPAVKVMSNELLSQIGYPTSVSNKSSESIMLYSDEMKNFRLVIDSDIYLKKEVKKSIVGKFKQNNQDLELPKDLTLTIEEEKENGKITRRFIIVEGNVIKDFEIRPWLPGTRKVWLEYTDKKDKWQQEEYTREEDYFFTTDFPTSSFMLSEAHTQGAPFIHGVGICMKPKMDDDEDAGEDPKTGLKGPKYYQSIEWNKLTGWGDLILLNLK